MSQGPTKLKVYVRGKCLKCVKIVNALETSGIPYKKINMVPGQARKTILSLPDGIKSLPVVVMPSGAIIQNAEEEEILQELEVEHDK